MAGVTTGISFPYPEGSDPPDGATQIRALAEAIDGHLSDPPLGSSRRTSNADVTGTSGTWQDIATAQATILLGGFTVTDARHLVIPRAGVYRVSVMARLTSAVANQQFGVMASINQSSSSYAAIAYGDSAASNRSVTLFAMGYRQLTVGETITFLLRHNGNTISVGAESGVNAEWIAP